MATPIKIKNSSEVGKQPLPADILRAELALNIADQRLYSKDMNDQIFEIGRVDLHNIDGGGASTTYGGNAYSPIDGGIA